MTNCKKYNFILSWLPSRERQGVMPDSSVPYFEPTRTAIEKLLQNQHPNGLEKSNGLEKFKPNFQVEELEKSIDKASTDGEKKAQLFDLEELEEEISIHGIIYLASDYANYSKEKIQEYTRVLNFKDTPSLSEIFVDANKEQSSLSLQKIDALNMRLNQTKDPVPLYPYELKSDFDRIVKIIIPINFPSKNKINDERTIYSNTERILARLFQDDKDAEININVLISGGTPAMRTIWFLTKYNNLFHAGGNSNLKIRYWDNQKDDNYNIQVKEAFIMDESSLVQGSKHSPESSRDLQEVSEKYQNKSLKEAVSMLELELINHYMSIYHQDKNHVAKQLGVDPKTIRNKLQFHKIKKVVAIHLKDETKYPYMKQNIK